MTSAVVKAYPPVFVAETSISFSVGDFRPGGNIAGLFNFTGFNYSNPYSSFNLSNPFNPFNASNPYNATNPFAFPNPFNATIPFNSTFPPFNGTFPSFNGTFPAFNGTFQAPVVVNDTVAFWRGVNAYFAFGKALCDAGGTGYSTSRRGESTRASASRPTSNCRA